MNANATLANSSNLFSETFGSLVGSILLVECTLGLIGNSIVVFAFAYKLVPLTPFCMLLLNLSVADIFADVTVIPELFDGIYKYIGTETNLAITVCGIIKFRLFVAVCFRVNVCTVAYISFIRTTSIENGSSRRILNKRIVTLYIVCTWMFSIASVLPLCFMITVNPKTGVVIPSKSFNTINATFHSLFYFIPQTILVVNFSRSVWHLWRTPRFQQSIILKGRKQITLLLLSLTAAYIIFLIPILAWQILKASGHLGPPGSSSFLAVYRPASIFAYLTTISDPVLYAVCWRGFRQGFKKTMEPTPRTSATTPNLGNAGTMTMSMASLATITSSTDL